MNSYFSDKQASDLIKKIFTPILLCLGLFGNTMSMVIFNKDSLKKHSTFRYLTLLSILDLCVLFSGCGQILLDVYFEIDIRSLNELSCKVVFSYFFFHKILSSYFKSFIFFKMHSFLVYFFTHFSSMLLAIMSIDRAFAILSKKGEFFTEEILFPKQKNF